MGAASEKVESIQELEAALERAKASPISYVITLDTDPLKITEEGGFWWDVAVPEVSPREEVRQAREFYEAQKAKQFKNL